MSTPPASRERCPNAREARMQAEAKLKGPLFVLQRVGIYHMLQLESQCKTQKNRVIGDQDRDLT